MHLKTHFLMHYLVVKSHDRKSMLAICVIVCTCTLVESFLNRADLSYEFNYTNTQQEDYEYLPKTMIPVISDWSEGTISPVTDIV